MGPLVRALVGPVWQTPLVQLTDDDASFGQSATSTSNWLPGRNATTGFVANPVGLV